MTEETVAQERINPQDLFDQISSGERQDLGAVLTYASLALPAVEEERRELWKVISETNVNNDSEYHRQWAIFDGVASRHHDLRGIVHPEESYNDYGPDGRKMGSYQAAASFCRRTRDLFYHRYWTERYLLGGPREGIYAYVPEMPMGERLKQIVLREITHAIGRPFDSNLEAALHWNLLGNRFGVEAGRMELAYMGRALRERFPFLGDETSGKLSPAEISRRYQELSKRFPFLSDES